MNLRKGDHRHAPHHHFSNLPRLHHLLQFREPDPQSDCSLWIREARRFWLEPLLQSLQVLSDFLQLRFESVERFFQPDRHCLPGAVHPGASRPRWLRAAALRRIRSSHRRQVTLVAWLREQTKTGHQPRRQGRAWVLCLARLSASSWERRPAWRGPSGAWLSPRHPSATHQTAAALRPSCPQGDGQRRRSR